MARWMIMLLALLAETAMANGQNLRQQAEAFAGQPVALDPRLPVPDCQRFVLGWRGSGQTAILATCEASGWRMVLPVGRRRQAMTDTHPVSPVAEIRRGDPVQVRVEGRGFRLLVDGVAMGNAGPGRRVVVRNLSSGRQMIATVLADGSLELSGKNF